MAQQTIFTCDRCGAPKGDANHWFRVIHVVNGVAKPTLWVGEWSANLIAGTHDRMRHICGASCLSKEVQEYAAGGGT
jgi:hypothetical protein